MKRKITVLTLSALLFALGVFAHAQQPTKIPRVGYISGEGDPNNPGPRTAAFRQGLRECHCVPRFHARSQATNKNDSHCV